MTFLVSAYLIAPLGRKFAFIIHGSLFTADCIPVRVQVEIVMVIESRWGEIFHAVQTGPDAHPASCQSGKGNRIFPGGKTAGAWR